MDQKSYLIILAGGVGSRFGNSLPKQFINLAGKPIIHHTIEAILETGLIDEIIVVYNSNYFNEIYEIAKTFDSKISLVPGGKTRLESTKAGVKAIESSTNAKVLIHDGVRPFISKELINSCLIALDDNKAVDVVIDSHDTIILSDNNKNYIDTIPNRKKALRGQTPQGFWLNDLTEIYDNIDNVNIEDFSDDCGIFRKFFPDEKIRLVEGSQENIKVTTPLDIFIASQLIATGLLAKPSFSKGLCLKGKVILIFGGSSGLGHDAFITLEKLGAKVFSASKSNGCDVTKIWQIKRLINKIIKKNGRIDAVINFAGILSIGKLASLSDREINKVIDTNYKGALNISRIAYPHLKLSKGKLILVSSSSYYKGRKDYAVYSSSKAAIVNLTQALSDEWLTDQIDVNCIVPRRSNTPMRWAAFPDEEKNVLLSPAIVTSEVTKILSSSHTGVIHHVN